MYPPVLMTNPASAQVPATGPALVMNIAMGSLVAPATIFAVAPIPAMDSDSCDEPWHWLDLFDRSCSYSSPCYRLCRCPVVTPISVTSPTIQTENQLVPVSVVP